MIRFYGEVGDIHRNYDFVHTTNAWTSWDGKLHLRSEALVAILSKTLEYVGSRYPLASMFRGRKFIERGWRVNAGQLLKIGMQISELDLTNPDVLEEQLVGVDYAYFRQVIDLVQKHADENGGKIDATYLVELIDRVF